MNIYGPLLKILFFGAQYMGGEKAKLVDSLITNLFLLIEI